MFESVTQHAATQPTRSLVDISYQPACSMPHLGPSEHACARFLNASLLARLARAGRLEALEEAYLMDCMECGACSFACPSGIPIVQLIRAGKAAVRKARR